LDGSKESSKPEKYQKKPGREVSRLFNKLFIELTKNLRGSRRL
jgi:hypothetical protein